MTEAKRDTAIATQKMREAELALQKLRLNRMPRVLSAEQQFEIVEAAQRFSGQKFVMTSLMGEDEGRDLAMQIVGVLDRAGWDHNGPEGIRRAVRTDHPVGIIIGVGSVDVDAGHVPEGAVELIRPFLSMASCSQPWRG